jgi:ABC-2 type transport system permease protein
MTITYYIIISFFSRLDTSEQTALKISEEIKNGVFSRYLLLPMGVKSYYFSLCISNMMVNFFLCIPALLVWILIFAKYFLLPEHFYNIVVFSPLLLLGLIWLMQSNLSIMLISFWLEEVYAFFHIKRVLFSFLLGEIIPILLFPLEFQNILKHLPFYYIYNISIEIYFGNRSVNLNDYVIIIIWNIFFYLLNSHIYRLAIKKYSGVGI